MPLISPTSIAKAQQFYDKKILNSKFLNNKVYLPAIKDKAKFAGQMALISALTKDAVGCYYYVTQSLSNEKIPEEKRKFVASLDLMNGILNVALQFTIGMWIDKKIPQWFDKTIGKKLEKDGTVKLANTLHKAIKKVHPQEIIKEADIAQHLRDTLLGPTGKAAGWLKVGFSAASVLIATQVITKRVIVPFLSTPLASWYKENFMDKKKGAKTAPLAKDTVEINKANNQQAQTAQPIPAMAQPKVFEQFKK